MSSEYEIGGDGGGAGDEEDDDDKAKYVVNTNTHKRGGIRNARANPPVYRIGSFSIFFLFVPPIS